MNGIDDGENVNYSRIFGMWRIQVGEFHQKMAPHAFDIHLHTFQIAFECAENQNHT